MNENKMCSCGHSVRRHFLDETCSECSICIAVNPLGPNEVVSPAAIRFRTAMRWLVLDNQNDSYGLFDTRREAEEEIERLGGFGPLKEER